MKNYYEILEVDKHASSEIIEKAFKTLAKKYHPDIHDEAKKKWAEENFKKINEAYEVLSDKEKRTNYDNELASSTIDYYQKYEELLKKQNKLKQELEFLKEKYNSNYINQTNYNNSSSDYSTSNTHYQEDSDKIFYNKNYNNLNENEIRNQEFDRAYRTILHNLGYTIKQKRTFKDFLALFITILIFVIIIFLLWHIPFTKDYLISFYEENSIIKAIVEIFIK